jgi:hypothetical protein
MKKYNLCLNAAALCAILFLAITAVKYNVFKIYADESKEVYEGWYQEFDYTGDEQCFEVPVSGEYYLETWGAQGGSTRGGTGGMGGYSYGKVLLKAGDRLYINVGGNGLNHYGYNGGGMGEIEKEDTYCYGGGATHIAAQKGLLSQLENVKNDIYIVAGGGGGGERTGVLGGIGGGGNADGTSGGAWEGYDDEEYFNYTEFVAEGGTQSEGGRYGNNYDNWNKSKGMSGIFGKGGDAYDHQYAVNNGYMEEGFRDYGGGGGGGWYGGGGIEWAGGGGGGSGHISDKLYDAGGESGVRSGDGYAKITFIKRSEYTITIKYMKYNPNTEVWENFDSAVYEHIAYGSIFNIPNGNCPTGYHLEHKDMDSLNVSDDAQIKVYYYPDKFALDVNGNLDGQYSTDVNGFGRFDVYINGKQVCFGVSDYYNTELLYGQQYEVQNITALTGKNYIGVSKGSLSGIITENVNIELNFETQSFIQLVNHYKWNAADKKWEYICTQNFTAKYCESFTPEYIDTPVGYYNYLCIYENGRKVTGEYTYSAYYYPNTYTLRFDANGGTCEVSEKSVLYGGYYGDMPQAVRQGCDFCGWYTKAEVNPNERVSEQTLMTDTKDVTLYAGWLDVAAPLVTLAAADEASRDFTNLWKNKPVNILLEIQDYGFAGIDKVTISNVSDGSVLVEHNYPENVMSDSFNIVIGNSGKFLYEGEYCWKVTATDKAGNTSEILFNTKLDYTAPVITDINGEYDSAGKPVTSTVYQFYDEDNFIWQKANDKKEGVNEVSGVESFSLYLLSKPLEFISNELTPYTDKTPYEIKYDFTNKTENEYAILLCAVDNAGNKSSRIIITRDGFNRMFRKTVPRENYA